MRHRIDLGNWKSIIGTTVLAAGLTLLGGAGITKADDCQGRIVKADHHLHEAIEHHGYESREAEHARTELHSAREYCWSHSHRWWDVEGNRWHSDRDWDDKDHEHYKDHDHDHDRDHQ